MCTVQPSFGTGVVKTPARNEPFALLDLSRKSSSSNNTLVVDRLDIGVDVNTTFGKPVALCFF